MEKDLSLKTVLSTDLGQAFDILMPFFFNEDSRLQLNPCLHSG